MPPLVPLPRNAMVLTGATLATLGAAPAGASVISDTAMFSQQNFVFVASSVPPNPKSQSTPTLTLQLDKFDPSLGTLTAITIALASHVTGSVSATGFAQRTGATVTSDLDIDLAVDVSGLAGTEFSTTISTGASCMPLPGQTFCLDFRNIDQLFTPASLSVPMASFGAFVGAGTTFDVNLTDTMTLGCHFTNPAGAPNPGCSAGSLSHWSLPTNQGTITITYTYNAVSVPEPGTLSLLGLGVAGAAFARKRQRARSS